MNNQQNNPPPSSHSHTSLTRPHVEVERYVKMVDGVPEIGYRNIIKEEALPVLKRHALSQPYLGEWDTTQQKYKIDPRYVGMTKAEVIEHKKVDLACAGDLAAMKEIDDRLLGKPKQQVETKNLNMTYDDFLRNLALQEDEREKNGGPEPIGTDEPYQLEL